MNNVTAANFLLLSIYRVKDVLYTHRDVLICYTYRTERVSTDDKTFIKQVKRVCQVGTNCRNRKRCHVIRGFPSVLTLSICVLNACLVTTKCFETDRIQASSILCCYFSCPLDFRPFCCESFGYLLLRHSACPYHRKI